MVVGDSERIKSQLYNEYQRVYVAPLHCPYYIFTQFPYKNYGYYYLPINNHIAPISYRSLGKRRLNRLYNRILLYMIFTNSPVGLCHFTRVLRCNALIVYTYSMMTHPSKNFRVLSRYYVHRCWICY